MKSLPTVSLKKVNISLTGILGMSMFTVCLILAASQNAQALETRTIDGTNNNLQNPQWGDRKSVV